MLWRNSNEHGRTAVRVGTFIYVPLGVMLAQAFCMSRVRFSRHLVSSSQHPEASRNPDAVACQRDPPVS